MKKISNERIAAYRKLASKNLWDIDNKDFHTFFARAAEEGVELVSNNFNTLGMFRSPHNKDLTHTDLAIIGVPMDLGVPNPRPGTRCGPEAVRYWSKDRNMVNDATGIVPFDLCSITDWGEMEFDSPYNLDDCIEQIGNFYADLRDKGITPLSVGGEHTITYGILSGLGRKEPVNVIHLDAHADVSLNFGGTKVSDASIFQVATCEGFIDSEKTIQIGMRGRGIMRSDFSPASGMRMFKMDEVRKIGITEVLKETKKIIGDEPTYLTIDSDVLDCSVMPGTTLPEAFGFMGHEVREIIHGLRGCNIIGADFMELSPNYDPTGMSSCLASSIVHEQLCLLAECRSKFVPENGRTHWK